VPYVSFIFLICSAKEKREVIDSIRYEVRNSASVNKERPSQLMAQVTAQLEAVRSAAFVPDNVSSADEQDEKDSSIWSDEDFEEQDELDEIQDAQDGRDGRCARRFQRCQFRGSSGYQVHMLSLFC
jgi:hypothetical protein